MDAVRRLEAVACDGYRSACSRARICDRLRFDDFFSFLSLHSPQFFSSFPRLENLLKSACRALRRMTQEGQLLT